MEANETNNAGTVAAAVMEKPFLVVCADMAFYNSREQSIGGYKLVFTVAEDEEAAWYHAQKAVPDGGIPLAAFDRADLLKIMDEMASRKLGPGESYNWTQDMTDAEMQTANADESIDAEES